MTRLALLALCAVACSVEPADYTGTSFRCPTGSCPPGFTCVDGVCIDDPGDSDAGTDAAGASCAASTADFCVDFEAATCLEEGNGDPPIVEMVDDAECNVRPAPPGMAGDVLFLEALTEASQNALRFKAFNVVDGPGDDVEFRCLVNVAASTALTPNSNPIVLLNTDQTFSIFSLAVTSSDPLEMRARCSTTGANTMVQLERNVTYLACGRFDLATTAGVIYFDPPGSPPCTGSLGQSSCNGGTAETSITNFILRSEADDGDVYFDLCELSAL